jgi:glyoxylase-like metal-dependent hydrolase (beta-lactamase superfamily II)
MQVGTFEILPVLDGEFRVRPTQTFAGTTDADWEPHRAILDENGMLPMTLGGFLVRGGPEGRVVLVDTGLGHHEMFGSQAGGKLLESLGAYGLGAQDITDVIFSHLHLDHVGWATDSGKPVFTNAVYRCDRRDWDYWIAGPPEALKGVPRRFAELQQAALTPVADRFQMWDSDGPVLPGIDVLHAPGHTPGSAIVVVSGGAERALMLGDAVHCPAELVEAEWNGIGDVDPELAKRTKIALLREIEGKDVPVAAAHFPGLAFGRLLAADGRRRWVM